MFVTLCIVAASSG